MITPAANIRRLVLPALDRTLSACASGISTLMLSPHAGHAPHQQSLLLVARFAGSKVTHRATSRRLTTRVAPDCFPPSPSKIPCATLFLAWAIVFSCNPPGLSPCPNNSLAPTASAAFPALRRWTTAHFSPRVAPLATICVTPSVPLTCSSARTPANLVRTSLPFSPRASRRAAQRWPSQG